MSSQRKGFLGGFFDNLKEEYNKSKEMKDSIKKFRDEAQKLENSDALKEARKKYVLALLSLSPSLASIQLSNFLTRLKRKNSTKSGNVAPRL